MSLTAVWAFQVYHVHSDPQEILFQRLLKYSKVTHEVGSRMTQIRSTFKFHFKFLLEKIMAR